MAFINMKHEFKARVINQSPRRWIWPIVLYLGFYFCYCCFCLLVCMRSVFLNTNFSPYGHDMLSPIFQKPYYSLISYPIALTKLNPNSKIMRLIFTWVGEHWFYYLRIHHQACPHACVKPWQMDQWGTRPILTQSADSQEPNLLPSRAKYFSHFVPTSLMSLVYNHESKIQRTGWVRGKKTRKHYLTYLLIREMFYDQTLKTCNYNVNFPDAFLPQI